MGDMKYMMVMIIVVVMVGTASSVTMNVVSYGARGDGKTDSTKAFARAWSAACQSRDGSVVFRVPRGRFLIGSVTFEGPCRSTGIMVFQVDGTVVAPIDYRVIGSKGSWITFHKVARLSIRGGTFDARGHSFWACRASKKSCPSGARSIAFSWCTNIVVSQLTSLNSQAKHITIDNSHYIFFKRLTIRAPSGSPNTDGVYVQSSSRVTISGAAIGTGDDCVAIGPGSRNLLVEKVTCGPGHGISIGSLGGSASEAGVQGITVRDSTFVKTQNGVRIKSWDRQSNGFATDIRFLNLVMNNVGNPIIIDQKYCPSKTGCPHQGSNVKISQVTYQNIKGTSSTKVAVNLYCSPGRQCRGIKLRNINLTYRKSSTTSVCSNARGTASGYLVPGSCLARD